MAKRSCTVGDPGERVNIYRSSWWPKHIAVNAGAGDRFLTTAQFRKLVAAGLTMCDESEKGVK